MIVVIANLIPPAVRGRMKCWFIEIKPNVFVSGVKDNVAKNVIDYLLEKCPIESDMIVLQSTNNPPYYKVLKKGINLQRITEISGLPLIFKN